MDCQHCKNLAQDYKEGKLTGEEKSNVQQHLSECADCKKTFRQNSPRRFRLTLLKRFSPKSWGLFAVLIFFILGTAFATGGMKKAANWWGSISVAEQESLKDIQKFGIGNSVHLEAVSNGIKVTITQIVADDIQTFVYYEVEDLEKDRTLRPDYSNRPEVSAEKGVFDTSKGNGRRVDSVVDGKNQTGNTYRGRIGILPIEEEEAEFDLKIKDLVEVVDSDREGFVRPKNLNSIETIKGEWSFNIQVKKEKVIEKEIDLETEIAGIPIKIDKLTIAPTATFLGYRHKVEQGLGLRSFLFGELRSGDAHYKRQIRGSLSPGDNFGSSSNWIRGHASFESMYYSTPDSVDIKVNRVVKSIPVNEMFVLDPEATKPQTFSFMGIELSIQDIELGKHTSFTLTEEWNEQREFERLQYEFLSKPISRSTNYKSEGVYIDESGERLEQEELKELNVYGGEARKIRYYPTEREVTLESENGEIIKPTGFRIHSYQVTTFPKEEIHIEL